MGLGPSTKETTLHHYKDPLVARLAEDAEVDFPGVVIMGTSDVLEQKMLVARRAGAWAEAMRLDGALVTIDSWGNCHIDFTSVIEALGERRIPLVGMSFVGNQAAFVVTNSYMDSILDLNKTTEGVESQIVGQNTTVDLDALKAVSILKTKIRKKNPERDFTVTGQREIRRILHRTFPVQQVALGEQTRFAEQKLTVTAASLERIAAKYPPIQHMDLRIIAPDQHNVTINALLDFSPIAVKVAGRPGEGITHEFSGVRMMLTAVEEGGFQPVNCGAAHGELARSYIPGRPGTPEPTDWIIQVDVRLAEGQGRTQEGIMAAHCACDELVKELREPLRGLSSSQAVRKVELWDYQRHNGLRIAVFKLVSGLGCLYDTVVMPSEPCACLGGTSIMDLGNMPLLLSPNEYRDGMVHSLT